MNENVLQGVLIMFKGRQKSCEKRNSKKYLASGIESQTLWNREATTIAK